MENEQVYMLQFISDLYGPRDFVAINKIDHCVIFGDVVNAWLVPAIDAQIVAHHQLVKQLLKMIQQGYRLVVASHHTNFLISPAAEIHAAIRTLEHRYYMSNAMIAWDD